MDGFVSHGAIYSFDFGQGLYTTPSIDYALKHVRDYGNGRVGALLIFDWSDFGGNIKTRHIKGTEWNALVKGHICIDNPAIKGPSQFSEDIFSGRLVN